jgi:hypothetical protein
LAGRQGFPFFDGGGEAGEIVADAPQMGLDPCDHRGRQLHPRLGGMGDNELEQHQQKFAEPFCRRGEGGSHRR